MTIISKALTVFIAAASLAFLGFVAISVKAGKNWEAEASAVPRYEFPMTEGERTTWTAQVERGGETVGSATPVLAEAIVRARSHLRDRQRQQIDQLDADIAFLEQSLTEYQAGIAADLPALVEKKQEFDAKLAAADQQIADLRKREKEKAEEAIAVRKAVRKRWEEILQLHSQIEEIVADRYRWIEQKKKLQDELARLLGTIELLERRRDQLLEAGAQAPLE